MHLDSILVTDDLPFDGEDVMFRRDREAMTILHPIIRPPQGVWFIYGWDQQAYPVNVFQDELDARRWCDEQSPYDKVIFWPYGMKFEDAIKKEIQEVAANPRMRAGLGHLCQCGAIVIPLGSRAEKVGGSWHFVTETCVQELPDDTTSGSL